jgi:diketogulonate reductase-like aldo/keto reductase
MEALVAAGKIARWGVSNLDRHDMEELWRAGGQACAANQIPYNITERGPEFRALPWLNRPHVPTMRRRRRARLARPSSLAPSRSLWEPERLI